MRGCEIAGCIKRPWKDPADIVRGENWWRCYQVDLITLDKVDDWPKFRKKWWAFLDAESLSVTMDLDRLSELATRLRLWFHEGLDPPGMKNWVLRLIQPEIFAAINGVWKVSHKGHPAMWSDALRAICVSGFMKLDEDQRLFIDVSKLEPDDNERIVDPSTHEAYYVQHYREVMKGTARELQHTPPDWADVAESIRRRTHKRKREYWY